MSKKSPIIRPGSIKLNQYQFETTFTIYPLPVCFFLFLDYPQFKTIGKGVRGQKEETIKGRK